MLCVSYAGFAEGGREASGKLGGTGTSLPFHAFNARFCKTARVQIDFYTSSNDGSFLLFLNFLFTDFTRKTLTKSSQYILIAITAPSVNAGTSSRMRVNNL